MPRGLLQIVQGHAEEYTKYILTEEDRTAVEWVWGPSLDQTGCSRECHLMSIMYLLVHGNGPTDFTWVPQKEL